MMRSQRCPKCEGREIWVIDGVGERGPEGLDLLRPVFRDGVAGLEGIGQFTTLICKACGYTEWYARGLDRLRENPPHGVRLLRPGDDDGPYR
jgi:hypothetical protein